MKSVQRATSTGHLPSQRDLTLRERRRPEEPILHCITHVKKILTALSSMQIEVIKEKTAIITFTNLEAGEYAFSLFHDENENNQMDSNMFGIPKEGYGFSTNFKPIISTPAFDDANFKIEGDIIQKIKIKKQKSV